MFHLPHQLHDVRRPESQAARPEARLRAIPGDRVAAIKLYTPYNNRECLHCHLGSRSFEEGATHNQDPQTLPKLKANQLSCTTSECHNLVHNVSQLKDAKLWQEAGK